ncbi:hypothetical protein [Nocardia paucivorans]|uniref:hypothetical protein n=1 Tax=Nocardia paucivorans TaxID=114259 RepID=UPI000316D19F|nr:hypothetical protein [Nocardia paucivorans]
MPETVGGKTFHAPEELAAAGRTPTAEELARYQTAFDEFDRAARTAPPTQGEVVPGWGGRFSDDLEGTRFAGWTRDEAGAWYDEAGRMVYDRWGIKQP